MRRESVARPDAIRQHNLALLLQQVHRDGQLTRAELTRRLALSRSTIGALVADLTELGLLDERIPSGGERAGRPSHVVAPRENGPYAVAVDVDVTRVCSAAIGIGGNVLARHDVNTRPGENAAADVAAHIVTATGVLAGSVLPGAWPIGIGVSVPGTVSRHDGAIEMAPNLGWRGEPFGSIVTTLLGGALPVSVGNDADVAMLAENLRGAARGCDDAVYLIGRVGVGAGILANGTALRGHHGHAGEVGHMVIDAAGPRCHCGKRGCVETYIGDKALLRLAGRRQTATPEAIAAVFSDATAGDETAADAVRNVATALGHTIGNLANLLNPERVIVGGSLTAVFDFAHDIVRKATNEYAMSLHRDPVQLCTPDLGSDSTLLGAAELAFAHLLTDPLMSRQNGLPAYEPLARKA
jgi:predicted NBD/HSP70 family sugar kinase